MADQSLEQTPEAVDALPDAALESAELLTPVTLREESDTLAATNGETEKANNSVENKVKSGRARSVARKGEVGTPEERENQKNADLNGADGTTQQQKKAPARKRTKPTEPTTSLTPESADTETAEPKKPATRQRKKVVELVVSDTEAENTSEQQKTTTRTRQTRAKSASPATAADAGSEQPKTTTRRRTKPVEPETPTAETVETPFDPVEINTPVSANASQAAELLPESVPQAIELEPVDAEMSVAEERMPEETDLAEIPASQEPPVARGEEENVLLIETARIGEESKPVPVAVIEEAPSETVSPPATERRHLVKSAALVSIGNFGSSAIGMLRQVVVGSLGAQFAGPFIAALAPANNFYQLLVNGAVSGALIPTFNDYSAEEKRNDLHRIVFTLVNLVLLITILASIGYTLIAPSFINFLVSGYTGSQRELALQYSQIIFFSLIALGPFSILLAALYALKEFGWPAFATAAYHIGIILGAIGVSFFGSNFIGPMALPLGVLVGSLGEIALLLPGMRKQKLRYMFVLDLKHPALRHIYKLYLPVFLGFIFTTLAVLLDVHLQSLTHNGALTTTAMGLATTLIQFPVGLVAAALSFAVLPTLSEHVRAGNDERFKQTLLLGFRVGLLLMIPAMVGLLALRTPITYLLFAHHKFGVDGANFTALALQNYAYQLPFVVLDQLLIFAFYARKNTKTPVVIGVVCIAFYLIVALPFYSNVGMPALALANTVQNSMHAIILLILLRKAIGSLHIRTTLPALLKICLAAALMGLVTWGLLVLLGHVSLFSLDHLTGQFLTVIVAGVLAIAVYVGAILLLKVEEINLVKGAVLAKLGKR